VELQTVTGLPLEHRWVFWDVDPLTLDLEADADYILARILEFGGIAEVRWALATYGRDRIHRFFREVGHPELSERTRTFWRAVFGAEEEEWASPPDWRTSRLGPWID
jgi:hypothetical protein